MHDHQKAQLHSNKQRIWRKTRAHEEEPQEKSRGQQEKQSSSRRWRVTRRAGLSVQRGGVSGAEIKVERLRQVHCGYYPYNIAIMTGAI